MPTFFVTFHVKPTLENEHYKILKEGFAHCWIINNDSEAAFRNAKFSVEKKNWKIEKVETLIVEDSEKKFEGNDIWLERYFKAQKEGTAICYECLPRDEIIITERTILKSAKPTKINYPSFLAKSKALSHKGKCLHYDSGQYCNEFIYAHSIQEKQMLASIADNGHVYTYSAHISDTRKNAGQGVFKKKGLGQVSTFRGFCKQHDNELFECIDNGPLIPTDQQVFLYAYRSICRELFVKENAHETLVHMLKITENKASKEFLNNYKKGTACGLANLKRNKEKFDISLKAKSYSDIRYELFVIKENPCIAFSSLLYPNFDFLGRKLQDLADLTAQLELISVCTAPLQNNEWGILFAWHKTSSDICIAYMRALATMVHDKHNLADMIFRSVLSENLAISPQWWENLPEVKRQNLIARFSSMVDTFSETKSNYLMNGLEGIVNWQISGVISEMGH